jgi:hypothetical protein
MIMWLTAAALSDLFDDAGRCHCDDDLPWGPAILIVAAAGAMLMGVAACWRALGPRRA